MNPQNLKKDLYKRTYPYAFKVIKFLEKLLKDSTSRILSNQLIRSKTSVDANLIKNKSASLKKIILTMKGKKTIFNLNYIFKI